MAIKQLGMSSTEHLQIVFVVDHKNEAETTMSARWTKNGHEVGVWVRYGQENSHREAFSMLSQGMWEALQDPDGFNVEQDERGKMTVPPYWDGLL